jgi:amino acid permease
MAADERTPLLANGTGGNGEAGQIQNTQHEQHHHLGNRKLINRLRLQAAATLGASLLGTGILAQPRACESTGLVAFILLSVFALTISHLTAMMLCRTSLHLAATSPGNVSRNKNSQGMGYADVVSIVLGRVGELGIMWCIVLMQIGCCVGYLVVIGDVFTPLIAHWSHDSTTPSSSQIIFFASTFVIAPLCVAVRNLSSLKYTSAVAMAVIMFFGGVVVANGIFVLSTDEPDNKRKELIHHLDDDSDADIDLKGPYAFPRDVGLFRSIPLISFAYFMHFNVLPVFRTLNELGLSAESAYSTASKLSFLLSGTVTVAFGIFGYLTFLNYTESDVLSNFAVSGTYISSFLNVVRAFYGVGLMLAYPVVLWEARENLKRIIFGAHPSPKQTMLPSQVSLLESDGSTSSLLLDQITTNEGSVQADGELSLKESFKVHAFLSLLLVYLTATLGALVTNLEVVFGFIGSTCTPVIAYVLPALVYLRSGAAARNGNELQANICLAIGCILVPFGLTIWVLDRIGVL